MTVKSSLILALHDLSKIYKMDGVSIHALLKVNLEIHEGEFISIVGPSGSGKSTLLHIIGLLDKQSTGKIEFLNKDISDYKEEDLAKLRNEHIGFIFQQFNLLARTSAIENVLLPATYGHSNLTLKKKRAIELLTKIGMGDRLKNNPNQLSGGQQQRVAIARSLINEPKIIFADEPTGNLDSRSGEEVFQILVDLNKEGKTVVIVTHDPDLAKRAKRIITLKDGQIVKNV